MPKKNKPKAKKGKGKKLATGGYVRGGQSLNSSPISQGSIFAVGNGGSPIVTSGGIPGGFPDRIRTKLVYTEVITLTSTTGAETNYDLSGNSAYDPNSTGSGGQPSNYDDFALHYLRYFVRASKCIVTGKTQTSAVLGHLSLVPCFNSVLSDYAGNSSQPYAVFAEGISLQSPAFVLSQQMSSAAMIGIPESDIRASTESSAVSTTNPVARWYWRLTYGSSDAASTSVCYVTVRLEYDVEFYGRIPANLDSYAERIQFMHQERSKRLTKCYSSDRKDEQKPLTTTLSPEGDRPPEASGGFIMVSSNANRGDVGKSQKEERGIQPTVPSSSRGPSKFWSSVGH